MVDFGLGRMDSVYSDIIYLGNSCCSDSRSVSLGAVPIRSHLVSL